MNFFTIFIIIISLVTNSSKTLSALESDESARRYIVTLPHYKSIDYSNFPREKLKPHQGIIELRDLFIEKVKKWEKINKKPMKEENLLTPHINVEVGKFRSIYLPTEIIEISKILCNKWEFIGKFFFGFQRNKIYVNRYDRLFGLQILIELTYFKNYSASSIIESVLSKIYEWKDSSCFDKGVGVGAHNSEKSELDRIPYIGMVEDFPVIKQNLLYKIGRVLRRLPPSESPPPMELPKTSKDSPWRYMHEIEGIGFSVFMHIFPSLRSDVLPLEAYGLGREVIGDEDYERLTRPFIQHPYKLNKDEARRDVTTGAAAAASSVSAAGPAAAAAASSADIAPPAAAGGVDSETVRWTGMFRPESSEL